MAVEETKAEASALVPGAHRAIREIDAGEGPFAGTLVTNGASVAVRVDAAALSGWAGWAHAGSEHVAGPVDVARRADGQDVLLPWCTERIVTFLGRRAAADAPLGAGEVGTLVASMLRGLGELGEAGTDPCTGGWWLTDDGRPLFVLGAGEDARDGVQDVLRRLSDGQPGRSLGRLLTAVQEGLQLGAGRPRLPRAQLERWEGELLAIAAPRPLRRDLHAPERARDIEAVRAAGRSAPVSRRDARVVREDAGGIRDRSRRLLAGAGAAADAVVLVLRKRLSRREAPRSQAAAAGAPRAGRRRSLVVAAVAAAAVLAGGLLWPVGATGDPADPDAPAAPTAVATDGGEAGDGAPGAGADREPPGTTPPRRTMARSPPRRD